MLGVSELQKTITDRIAERDAVAKQLLYRLEFQLFKVFSTVRRRLRVLRSGCLQIKAETRAASAADISFVFFGGQNE